MENLNENEVNPESADVTKEAAPEPSPQEVSPSTPEPSNESGPQTSNAKGALAALVAIVLLFAAFSILNSDGVKEVARNDGSASGAAVVIAVSNEAVGDFLVDEDGMTLYVRNGQCTGGCLDSWPPYLYDGEPALGELGLVPRKDTGDLQYTYNDGLLYYFIGDEAPGDTNGHGQNGWSVVRPN